jgi:hypothetical protein
MKIKVETYLLAPIAAKAMLGGAMLSIVFVKARFSSLFKILAS